MLELKDATLTIGGRELFRNLSMMAQNGQLTCITGPSGSGKTAMMQVLLGFLRLDDGLVSVDGELLTPLSAPTFRKMMAYVPQSHVVDLHPFQPNVKGMEAVWAPYVSNHYQLTPIDEHLDVPPMATKPMILVDDPDAGMLTALKSLANQGHTVVVASQQEAFLNASEKIVTL